MARENKQELGAPVATAQHITVNPPSPAPAPVQPPTQAPVAGTEVTPPVDPQIAIRKLARERIRAYFPNGQGEISDKFVDAFARYDPRETRLQPAEMWNFEDQSLRYGGRF